MSANFQIKEFLLRQGFLLAKPVAGDRLEAFFARLRQHYVSMDLIRVGGDSDGGYLLPDILDEVTCCFSPGVDQTSTFERALSTDRNIRSYMADASVDGPAIEDPNFDFEKKFLGNRDEGVLMTLGSWVDRKVGPDTGDMLLQMDIEGAEYDILTLEDTALFRRFSCILIEFHYVERLFDKQFYQLFSSVMEKLYRDFSICHIHLNNCCGVVSREGFEIPRVIEMTLVRNDYAKRLDNGGTITIPHPLDRRNVDHKEDIALAPIWWKQSS